MYYHLKHEKFIAAPWQYNKLVGELLAFSPGAPYPNRKFRNNTFGFEFDGPIFIPKVFDGRNKMFFMISYEGLRERLPSGQIRTLPSDAQIGGDFSGLLDRNGSPVTIYDPLTTDQSTGLRQPFVGNRVPSNRINPVAARVAGFYPKPNSAGETPARINNYSNLSPARNGYNQWVGKLDYRINPKNNVFFRFGETPWENFARIVWGTNEAEPSNEAPSTRRALSYAADWDSSVRVAITFLFLMLLPGLALTEIAGMQDRLERWVVAIGASLALETLICVALVYSGVFSVGRAFGAVVGLTAAVAILAGAHAWRDARD